MAVLEYEGGWWWWWCVRENETSASVGCKDDGGAGGAYTVQ